MCGSRAVGLPADVIVEPEILHFPRVQTLERRPGARLLGEGKSTVIDLPAATPLTAFTGVVAATGGVLFGAEVIVFCGISSTSSETWHRVQVGREFLVSFAVPAGGRAVAMLILPAAGHWSMVIRNPVNGAVHDCSIRTTVGPLTGGTSSSGSAVRIRCAENGLWRSARSSIPASGRRVPRCSAINVGAFHRRKHRDPEGGRQRRLARGEVCGTIGARPLQLPNQHTGIAPGRGRCSAARGLPAERRSQPGDMANAMGGEARANATSISINMSLGAASPSR